MNAFISTICNFVPKTAIIAILFLSVTAGSYGQASLPEVFGQGSISEQIEYLEERTRIYEDYRAIREDMFQKLAGNTLDTLNGAKLRISELMDQTGRLDLRIDSVSLALESTQVELEAMTRTKNSIRMLGIEIRKVPYNAVMWTIIAVLILLLGSGYLAFKQTRSVTLKTKKDLNELKEEFEEYRVKTRLDREKTAMSHFNEVKKLKEKLNR